MKIGVSLGMTICTNSEMRNFARFGFEITDVDVDGDVKAQAEAGVSAMMEVFDTCNEGMEKAIVESLTIMDSPTESISDDVEQLRNGVNNIITKLVPNIVKKVKELDSRVDGLSRKK